MQNKKKSTATVYKELYVELSKDSIEGASEAKKLDINLNNSAHIMGGNSSNEKKSHYLNAKKLNKKIKKGHFFYTPSSTYGANHGHVGLFYSKTAIVESVPGAGVRRISVSKRRVDNKGAVLKSVTVSTKKRDAAANWANSRVGKDKYSTNFFNNRTTSHYGDKNCSKLIWSAYKLKAHIDLDNDKGKGVYPRDIRDSKLTKKVATI